MPFDVFHFDSTPGLNLRLLPFVADEMLICTALPFTKLTIARSLWPRVPGPSHVQIEASQPVLPHFASTCFLVMSSFTPAIEVPGLIAVLFGCGSLAPAVDGSTRTARRRAGQKRLGSCRPFRRGKPTITDGRCARGGPGRVRRPAAAARSGPAGARAARRRAR